MYLQAIFLIFFIIISNIATAQNDSIIFGNKDVIVGEIKQMDKGVLKIETVYSDSDFLIEWLKVTEVYTEALFLITTSNGSRYSSKLKTTEENLIQINDDLGNPIIIKKDQIVYLKSLDDGFWSKLYASVDVGFSYTKANSLRQLNINSNIGYFTKKWSADITFKDVNSTQDNVEPTKRTEGVLSYRYLLPKDWYTLVQLSFLSNTEQKIDLRTNGKLGMGKFVIHTNRKYWGFNAGGSFNNEKFSTDSESFQSIEAFFGTELNLYDIGDFSLLTNATAYPSITDEGRWRSEFKVDTKYDLPLEFYIKLSFSLNYDNRPVEGASETDYVFQTSFGWEL